MDKTTSTNHIVSRFKANSDAPIVSTILAIAVFIAIPTVLCVSFIVWPDSLARQIAAAGAALSLMVLVLFRNKFETLLLASLFFSQFSISLHSFSLAAPAELQIYFSDIILLLLILVAYERKIHLKIDTVGYIFLALISWFAITTYTSAHLHKSLVFTIEQLKYFIFYLLALNLPTSDKFSNKVYKIILFVVIVQGIVAIAQAIHGGPLGLTILGEFEKAKLDGYFIKGSFRSTGTIFGANGFAGYMSMLLVFLTPVVFVRRSLLLYGGYAIGIIALILPLSRAGWLSFLIGFLCVVLMMVRSKMVKWIQLVTVVLAGVLVLSLGFALYSEKILHRFQDKESVSSATGRIDQFSTAWPVLMKFPIVGMGPGVTEFFGRWNNDRKYVRQALSGVDMPNQVHNSQLQIALESGIPGVIIFIVLMLSFFKGILQKYRTISGEELVPLLRIGGLCAAVAVMVHISFGTEFNTKNIFLMLWLLLGFARGWNRLEHTDRCCNEVNCNE